MVTWHVVRGARIGDQEDGDAAADSPWARNQQVTPNPVGFTWARTSDEPTPPSSVAEAS